MASYRLVYDSRHLQADCQEPGSAPEPTLGNRVWAPFYRDRRFCDVNSPYVYTGARRRTHTPDLLLYFATEPLNMDDVLS